MSKALLILLALFISSSIYSQVDSTILDIIDFESPYPHLFIDSSDENSWQIGVPQKAILDSAYSTMNAIVTDTITPYPVNDSSYFDIRIGDFNGFPVPNFSIFLNFKHKYETDTLKDGGYISISYDNGATFNNIITDPNNFFDQAPGSGNLNARKLYSQNDTLINEEFGFSGSSNGWITTWFGWFDLPVKSTSMFFGDTLIIRFNFISDSINTGKEGWMIDDINLVYIDWGSSLREFPEFDFKLFPNPTSRNTTIEVEEFKKLDIQIIDLNGRISKKLSFRNSELVQIDNSDLEPGVYFLQLRLDDKFSGTKSLVIE